MNQEQFNTFNLLTAHANTTVLIVAAARAAGDTKVPHMFGYMTVLVDSAHTIAFYDGPDNTGTLICTKPASLAAGTYWFRRPVSALAAVVAASFAGNIVIGYI